MEKSLAGPYYGYGALLNLLDAKMGKLEDLCKFLHNFCSLHNWYTFEQGLVHYRLPSGKFSSIRNHILCIIFTGK
ncbi:hypothetical protein L2E82_01870 [Cichorium intybus]|uniref:Uncharacterized protein n=1 Tax=Cichorium intybus TaxID=13427 RepID=A0ACB9GZS3_CICIN|nr:hypothetical protein L2E82_01870 [Cichorium intybus]